MVLTLITRWMLGPTTYSSSRFTHPPSNGIPAISGEKAALAATKVANSNSVPAYMWDAKDPDLNDALHNPDPVQDRALDRSFTIFSPRGWSNVSALALLIRWLACLVHRISYPYLGPRKQSGDWLQSRGH
ncbi:hypothetical protein QCA50_001897 [Cerrena zonata]|uniref:Uncharacterized protein n=1 Tax=Cerrena zonata TaxID=2478898 RepID=A0AAW0GSB0_9APHY